MKTSQLATLSEGMRQAEKRAVYPFAAIVGQHEMKLGLILNVIDPSIGGVLIMGHRGTGKSTAVRGLANLLPEIWVVRGCPYQCDPTDVQNACNECFRRLASGEKLQRARGPIPVVDLPLGATEDRVCGSIDIQRALGEGLKAFEPGLLARANRGFLYIDEVNLLEDHLMDLLLDVSATGRNTVERESISIEHPARFVLIGSGNPEEGELRPQLLDRFGFHVAVKTENDLDGRVEIVERREAYERNPEMFCASLTQKQQALRNKITRAQKKFGAVRLERSTLKNVAQLCAELKIDGHRGELTISRGARALAAFEGRQKVTEEDVRRVALMALRHRLRRDPLEETAGTARIQQSLDRLFPEKQTRHEGSSGNDGERGGATPIDEEAARKARDQKPRRDAGGTRQSGPGTVNGGAISAAMPLLPSAPDAELRQFRFNDRMRTGQGQSISGRPRNQCQTGVKRMWYNYERGRYARAVSFRKTGARVAIDATLRALAGIRCQMTVSGQMHSLTGDIRHATPLLSPANGFGRVIPVHALRFKQLRLKSGTLFVVAIDASGSMARNRISQAKGAALNLLKQSYIRRDSVAIVGFRGISGEVLLPPSRSMLRARLILDSIGVGGGTPLSAGLACSLKVAKGARGTKGQIVLLVFTDGHANVSLRTNAGGDRAQRLALIEKELVGLGSELRKAEVITVVIDTQNGFRATSVAAPLAQVLGAEYKCLQLQSKASVAEERGQQ